MQLLALYLPVSSGKVVLALEEKKITFKMPSDCMLGSSFAIELILIASVKSVS